MTGKSAAVTACRSSGVMPHRVKALSQTPPKERMWAPMVTPSCSPGPEGPQRLRSTGGYQPAGKVSGRPGSHSGRDSADNRCSRRVRPGLGLHLFVILGAGIGVEITAHRVAVVCPSKRAGYHLGCPPPPGGGVGLFLSARRAMKAPTLSISMGMPGEVIDDHTNLGAVGFPKDGDFQVLINHG